MIVPTGLSATAYGKWKINLEKCARKSKGTSVMRTDQEIIRT